MKPVSSDKQVLDLSAIQRRVDRLSQVGNRRQRAVLMYDVLKAIADQSLPDAPRIAADIVKAVADDRFFSNAAADGNGEKAIAEAQLIVEDDKEAVRFQCTLDYLYKKSRANPSSRSDWEQAVRSAAAIEDSTLDRKALAELMDKAAKETAVKGLDTSKGLLLLTSHNGLVRTARKLFATLFPKKQINGMQLSAASEGEFGSALFAAFRVLQSRGVVLIAPDGQRGKQTGTLDVLGTTTSAGEGAAYLAYETRCNTAWYSISRVDTRFIPVIEPGPTRTGNESLKEFQDRLYRFYSEKIEAVLTGDPRNIAVWGKWPWVFADAERQLNNSP